jgi:NADPH:quinone reductase-like Zn-dependent oxidoreductase
MFMPSNQAIVVKQAASGKLVVSDVGMPTPLPFEALVRVTAISLNRGETRRAMQAEDGWRPGWDLAGVVEQAAADGTGPSSGTRVVGFLPSGAWACYATVPTRSLAALPEAVTFAQAATLPVAGLTALHALTKRGLLLHRRVLVTGATGGVGDFAIQLARLAGARVAAAVRRPEQATLVKQVGADDVVVGEDIAAFEQYAPYDLVVESVGGQTLAAALAVLAKDGVCVSLGVSASNETTFDVSRFFRTGRTTLYGFILFNELDTEPAAVGLAHLAGLIAEGKLQPTISVEAPWTQIADVARQLLERRYPGKAVLHVASPA